MLMWTPRDEIEAAIVSPPPLHLTPRGPFGSDMPCFVGLMPCASIDLASNRHEVN
jgi:hypothetical protein